MDDLRKILSRWLPVSTRATVEVSAGAAGFSGAQLWRVNCGDRKYALRKWPPTAPTAERMAAIDGLQLHLSDRGIPAPRPVMTGQGAASICEGNTWWSLNGWLPGVADFWSDPRPERLRAALAMLARLHLVAARFPQGDPEMTRTPRPSPAMAQRFDRMTRFILTDLMELRSNVDHHADLHEKLLAVQALDLAERLSPPLRKALEKWLWAPLPLQWCLRDIWHDHVLFTGDVVTGILDFGATSVDSPAADVARLLGSMVEDDRDGWRIGLDAYEAIRPLSWAEQDAEWLFDATGVVLSAINWVIWLIRDGSHTGRLDSRAVGVARLERLVNRLHTLARRMDR